MKTIYISKKDWEALHSASDYLMNLIESCTAEEGSPAIEQLNETHSGIGKIIEKARL